MPSLNEAAQRQAYHYSQVAEYVDGLNQQDKSHRNQAWELFRKERPQLDQARFWLHQQSPTYETDELLLTYGTLITQIALETLCYDIRQEIIPNVMLQLVVTRRLQHRELEADVLDTLGIVYAFLGDYYFAIPCFESALKLAHEIGDLENAVDYRAHLTQARKFVKTSKRPAKAIAYTQPGTARTRGIRSAETREAEIEYWEKALTVAQESSQPLDATIAAYEAGLCYAARGCYKRAIPYYMRALELSEKNDLWWNYFQVSTELTFAYVMRADYASAMELLSRLVGLSQQHGFAWAKEIDPLFQEVTALYTQFSSTGDREHSVRAASKHGGIKAAGKWVDTKIADIIAKSAR